MFRTRMAITAFIAALVVSALASISATAVTAGWMLNGRLLKEEGLSSAALSTTASVDKPIVLESASISIECKGTVEGVAPAIREINKISSSSLIFTNCASLTVHCEVPATIGTVPILAEATLGGSLAVRAFIRSETGSALFTIMVLSPVENPESCAVEGIKLITGDVEVISPEGQDERTNQLMLVDQPANGLLKIASSAASLSGATLLLLGNRQTWSFL